MIAHSPLLFLLHTHTDRLTEHTYCALEWIIFPHFFLSSCCSLWWTHTHKRTHTHTIQRHLMHCDKKAINLPTISWLNQHDNALKKAVCSPLQLTTQPTCELLAESDESGAADCPHCVSQPFTRANTAFHRANFQDFISSHLIRRPSSPAQAFVCLAANRLTVFFAQFSLCTAATSARDKNGVLSSRDQC